jgi:hypothetical protein
VEDGNLRSNNPPEIGGCMAFTAKLRIAGHQLTN